MASIGFSAGPPSLDFYAHAFINAQSIEGNYTQVRMVLECISRSSGGWAGYAITQYGSINGVAAGNRTIGTGSVPSPGNYLYSVVSGYVNVGHNADGTRGGCVFATSLGSADSDFNGKGTSGTYSDFPAIPRGPRVKSGGTWRSTVGYVRVGGVWKVAIPYVKSGGTWKVGGG